MSINSRMIVSQDFKPFFRKFIVLYLALRAVTQFLSSSFWSCPWDLFHALTEALCFFNRHMVEFIQTVLDLVFWSIVYELWIWHSIIFCLFNVSFVFIGLFICCWFLQNILICLSWQGRRVAVDDSMQTAALRKSYINTVMEKVWLHCHVL